MTGAELIAEERQRQITQEGWKPERDDTYDSSELVSAAVSYALNNRYWTPYGWPWELRWWKPSDDHIRNLTKAGALIAAEIDRLQRLKAASEPKGDQHER